jgi:hypothetical protein
MFKAMAAFAGMVAVLALGVMPASAQLTVDDLTEEQADEMFCVYDWLGVNGNDAQIVNAYVLEKPDSEAFDKGMTLLDETVADCVEEFGWDKDTAALATALGLHGVVMDVMFAKLKTAGITEEQLKPLGEVVNEMSDADLDAFIDGTWYDSAEVKGRVTQALTAKGLVSEAVQFNALFLIEANIVGTVAEVEWLKDVEDKKS